MPLLLNQRQIAAFPVRNATIEANHISVAFRIQLLDRHGGMLPHLVSYNNLLVLELLQFRRTTFDTIKGNID